MRDKTKKNFNAFIPAMLLIFIAVLPGCTNELKEYYPLEVGNLWTFKTNSMVTNTNRTDRELIEKRDGSTYTFESGEVMINMGTFILNKNGTILLKTPFEKGTTWNDIGVKGEITAVGEPYKVPAGEFSDTVEVTIEYQRPDKDDPQKIFTDRTVTRYAKGIGPISYYYEVKRPDGETIPTFRSELVSLRNVK